MCLIVSVHVQGLRRQQAESIKRTCTSEQGLVLSGGSLLGRHGMTTFHLGDTPGSCSCGLLVDDADWNAPAWSMIPAMSSRLAWTLEQFQSRLRTEWYFSALWVGEPPEETVDVRANELVDLVKQDKVGTKTRYRVTS